MPNTLTTIDTNSSSIVPIFDLENQRSIVESIRTIKGMAGLMESKLADSLAAGEVTAEDTENLHIVAREVSRGMQNLFTVISQLPPVQQATILPLVRTAGGHPLERA